eukprot:GHVS01034147.1.p1 GENE.GHVS01034147.1~~GHVS01034147.1.p1  ORF type:complete len:326 (+),score=30.14 GHVS01034147.1:110-979(+)
MSKPSVGLIGGGVMAQTMVKGFILGEVCSAIHFYDPRESARSACLALGMVLESSNQEVCEKCDIVIVTVKSGAIRAVGQQLGGARPPHSVGVLMVTCFGITISRIKELFCLQNGWSIVRVMPNTACAVLQSATGFCAPKDIPSKELDWVFGLLETVGVVHQVSESQLDAVAGLSGSGPAFVYTMIESMVDAGVLEGLPRGVATSLALQTITGACTMVKETGKHPAQLRDMVTCTGGATMAGMEALERSGFRSAVISAVSAAARSAKALCTQRCGSYGFFGQFYNPEYRG